MLSHTHRQQDYRAKNKPLQHKAPEHPEEYMGSPEIRRHVINIHIQIAA